MGLISLAGGDMAVRDWTRLKELARFDASYLHVRGGEPVTSLTFDRCGLRPAAKMKTAASSSMTST